MTTCQCLHLVSSAPCWPRQQTAAGATNKVSGFRSAPGCSNKDMNMENQQAEFLHCQQKSNRWMSFAVVRCHAELMKSEQSFTMFRDIQQTAHWALMFRLIGGECDLMVAPEENQPCLFKLMFSAFTTFLHQLVCFVCSSMIQMWLRASGSVLGETAALQPEAQHDFSILTKTTTRPESSPCDSENWHVVGHKTVKTVNMWIKILLLLKKVLSQSSVWRRCRKVCHHAAIFQPSSRVVTGQPVHSVVCSVVRLVVLCFLAAVGNKTAPSLCFLLSCCSNFKDIHVCAAQFCKKVMFPEVK